MMEKQSELDPAGLEQPDSGGHRRCARHRRGHCHRLGRMGATVVLTARDQARLAEVKADIEQQGGKAFALPCDLTDEKAVAALGKQVGRNTAAATFWSTMPA